MRVSVEEIDGEYFMEIKLNGFDLEALSDSADLIEDFIIDDLHIKQLNLCIKKGR